MGIENLIDTHKSVDYINTLWQKVSNLGIKMDGMSVDHIGFRISWGENGEGDYSNYLAAKAFLSNIGAQLISEAIIPMNSTGRPISIFKLLSPLKTNGGDVWFIEIPAPRYGIEEEDKIDHIEIVLRTEQTINSFFEENRDYLGKYVASNIKQILENEHASINPDLPIVFEDGSVVKFHKKDIETVVSVDQKTTDVDLLQNKLREDFARQNPGVFS